MPLVADFQVGTILIIVVLVALPLGALVFALGAGNALDRVGKGGEALDVDAEVQKLLAADTAGPSLGEDRALRDEVRQLVIARNERRQRQGKEPLDVEREI